LSKERQSIAANAWFRNVYGETEREIYLPEMWWNYFNP